MSLQILPRVRNTIPDFEELVARILCYGINTTADCLELWREVAILESGFIHGIPLILDERTWLNTAVVDSMAVGNLAVRVELDGARSGIRWRGSFVRIEPVAQPRFCLNGSVGGLKNSDFIRLHSPHTMFYTPVRECIFGVSGNECKFCTFVMKLPRPRSTEDSLELVKGILSEVSAAHMAIGGGTPNEDDFGARYYSQLCHEIKRAAELAISVEIVPPLEREPFELLLNSGVNSLIMSLEFWDEKVRKALCPGKAIVSRERYFECWDQAMKTLGPGQISSVLLVGVEPLAATFAGIDELVARGVLPTLIPFRPYDNSGMARRSPTLHEHLTRAAEHAANSLRSKGLSPGTHSGCAECGGCSMERLLLADG